MELYGSKKIGRKSIRISDVVIRCDFNEIDSIISFLTHAKDVLYLEKKLPHDDVIRTGQKMIYPHYHYRDWDKNWKKENPDIIVITPLKALEQVNGDVEWVNIE